METFYHDLRYSLRSLIRTPGFTILAVLALAIGTGANTAIFSVVNSVLLRPLAYSDPARLAVILHQGTYPVAPADYFDWCKDSKSFEQMGAAQFWGATLTGRDQPEVLKAVQLSANMFDLLKVPPALGRTFREGEDHMGSDHIVVLSHQLWQRRFAGDPNVIGLKLTLNGEPYTVIGVMPAAFQFAPFWATNAEIWAPLSLDKRIDDRGGRSLRVFARLRPGVSLAQAQSEINVICSRLERQYPDSNTGLTAQVVPLQEKVVGNIRPTLLVLLGTVTFVLLIACTNVVNLALARSNGKQRETAVRLALGSSRLRLVRQSIIESLLLSATGAVLGLILAKWSISALLASLPPASLPRQNEVHIDWNVLVFTTAISIVIGLVCGTAPALRAWAADLNLALKSGGRGSTNSRSQQRTRGLLVVSQVAIAMILLVGAGLMLRSFSRLLTVDPGFNPHHLLTMQVAAGGERYPTGPQRIRFFDQLRPRLEAIPGVQSVSLVNHLPINGDFWTRGIVIGGRPTPPPGERPGAAYRVVQPGYFATMQVPLLNGRDFTPQDREDSSRVVIVNEILARRHWPNTNPIGQRMALSGDTPTQWMTIVGIAKNIKQTDWTAPPVDEMYLPYAQSDAHSFSYMTVVLRAAGDPTALTRAVETTVHSLDKDVPLSHVETMEKVIGDTLWRGRLSMFLLSTFAAVALLLAALGIYGVISYSVSQRRGEIGVRMALGARSADVLRMILRQGLVLAIAGTALGLLGSLILTRSLTALIYDVKPTDPITFLAAPALLLGIAALACSVPALRASRVDPGTTLRYE